MLKVVLATTALSLLLGFGLPSAENAAAEDLDRAAAATDSITPHRRAL